MVKAAPGGEIRWRFPPTVDINEPVEWRWRYLRWGKVAHVLPPGSAAMSGCSKKPGVGERWLGTEGKEVEKLNRLPKCRFCMWREADDRR